MDNKRLYKVNVEHVLYVMAEDEEESCYLAENHCAEEYPSLCFAQEITSPTHNLGPDHNGSLPWGGDGITTLNDIIYKLKQIDE